MTRPAAAGSIRIAPYDPAWPAAFEQEAARLRAALGSIARRIEHVGATSIPGLDGKPVIDVQISVEALHPLEPHRRTLAALGYTHCPTPSEPDYVYFHRPAAWPHTHHVHLCELGEEQERRHLAFRDYLRDHPELVAAYADEKRRLAALHVATSHATRSLYSEAKSAFIVPVVERALAEGYPRD